MIGILNDRVVKHINNISEILNKSGERIEGNLICDVTAENHVDEQNRSKIENLITVAKGKQRICEIGVNAAHSLLLMVDSNPTAHYTVFDLNGHSYTHSCIEYVKNAYPSTDIKVIYGDTNITLHNYLQMSTEAQRFDMIHVDGGHELPTVVNDFIYSRFLLKPKGIVVFDDYNFHDIKVTLDYYIERNVIQKIDSPDIIDTGLHYIYSFKTDPNN
jgi:predicted O-methyltransferase YrrM